MTVEEQIYVVHKSATAIEVAIFSCLWVLWNW
jgi:hypothetical protein